MGLSIRTRIILIITGITHGCLSVGFVLVGLHQVDTFRSQRLQAMAVLADAVGDVAVSALASGDASDGEAALRGLAQFTDVESAALYDPSGKRFATYQRKGIEPHEWPSTLAGNARSLSIVDDRVTRVRKRVIHEGADYGTIEVVASNEAMRREIVSL